MCNLDAFERKSVQMNCEICHRAHHTQKLPFLCAVDGRNRLYEGRIAHATALIENEGLEQQINSVLATSTPSSGDDAASKTVRLERVRSEEVQAADRTSQIIAQADRLRAEVVAAKRDIAERKKNVSTRKADLAQTSNGINARRTRALDDTERSIQMTRYKWNRVFDDMSVTRGYLCMEAARLYGLRRIKKRNRYELGGVEMIELPGMIRRFACLSALVNKLTVSRCIARGHIGVTRPYHPCPVTCFPLPGYPLTSRVHTSSQRLSKTDHLLPGLVLSPRRSAIPRDCCDTPDCIFRADSETYSATSATIHRQATTDAGKRRPFRVFAVH